MKSTDVPISSRRSGHQVEDLRFDRGVEAGGGLVENQQRGSGRDRHGDHDPLQHPSGELMRIAPGNPGRIGDLNLLQDLDNPLLLLAAGNAHQVEDDPLPAGRS